VASAALFVCGLLPSHSLAQQIVMINKWLWSFSVFVTDATKYFTTSDGINQIWSNEREILQVCVSDLAIIGPYAKHLFSVWSLRLYHIFSQYPINGTIFRKEYLHKKCIFICSTTFVWNISHSKKNSARNFHELYIYLHVKCPLFLSDFNQTWFFSLDFLELLKYQFS